MGTRYSITVYDKDDGLFYKAQFPHDGDISCAGFELYMMAQEPTDVIKMVKTWKWCLQSPRIDDLIDVFNDSNFEYVLNSNGSISVSHGCRCKLYSIEMQLMNMKIISRSVRFYFLNLFCSKSIIMKELENGQ